MRQTATVLLVFAAAFGAAFWLFNRGSDPAAAPGGGRRIGEPPRAPSNGEPGSGVVGRGGATGPGAATGGAAAVDADFPADARRDLGVVRGRFSYPEGTKLASPSVRTVPAGGAQVKCDFEGFEFVDVPPGSYRVDVDAFGVVPRAFQHVAVEAGRVTRLDVALEPGVEVAGKVVEGFSQQPIAGVAVTIGGVRMVTDLSGNFRAPVLMSPQALQRMTAEHPEYDRLETRPANIGDTTAIVLALSKGAGHVIGRFALGSATDKPPAVALVRLYRVVEANKELRREIVVRDSVDFEMKGVQQEDFQLEVDFPGTARPRLFADVRLREEPVQLVELPLSAGGRLSGRVVAHGRAYGPAVLELIDAKSRVYAETTTGPDGVFAWEPLPPGDYAVRFKNRFPPMQSAFFTLPTDGKPLAVELDHDLGRVALVSK